MKPKPRGSQAPATDCRPSFPNDTFDHLAIGTVAYQQVTSALASAGSLYQRRRNKHPSKRCFGRGEFISAYVKALRGISLAPPDVNRWMAEIESNPNLSLELTRRSGCINKKLHLTLIQSTNPKLQTARLSQAAKLFVTLFMDGQGLLHFSNATPLSHHISSNIVFDVDVSLNNIIFRCPWDIKTSSSRSIIDFDNSPPSSPIRTTLRATCLTTAESLNQTHAYQFKVPERVLRACRQGKAHRFLHQCRVDDAKIPFIQRLLDAALGTRTITSIEVEYCVVSTTTMPNTGSIPADSSAFGVFRAATFVNVTPPGSASTSSM